MFALSLPQWGPDLPRLALISYATLIYVRLARLGLYAPPIYVWPALLALRGFLGDPFVFIIHHIHPDSLHFLLGAIGFQAGLNFSLKLMPLFPRAGIQPNPTTTARNLPEN